MENKRFRQLPQVGDVVTLAATCNRDFGYVVDIDADGTAHVNWKAHYRGEEDNPEHYSDSFALVYREPFYGRDMITGERFEELPARQDYAGLIMAVPTTLKPKCCQDPMIGDWIKYREDHWGFVSQVNYGIDSDKDRFAVIMPKHPYELQEIGFNLADRNLYQILAGDDDQEWLRDNIKKTFPGANQ